MAIQLQGNGGTIPEVGGTTFRALHTHVKPLEYGALGHYRSTVRFLTATSQTSNANLWTVRNSSTNFIVPTRLRLTWTQTGAVTTAARYDLEMRRATSFTVVDTTNTVTPTVSPKRTTGMAAAPGNAQIRHVTVAGAAAGMTGGTMTADGGAAWLGEVWCIAAVSTTAQNFAMGNWDLLDDVNGTHPFTLAQNEGLIIRPPTAGSGTAFVTSIVIDFSWAEVTAF